ncbi:MAG: hypothetical protein JJ902_23420 [Roseibium sp.]|nr:hypothetical protein [Roseibium sp.]
MSDSALAWAWGQPLEAAAWKVLCALASRHTPGAPLRVSFVDLGHRTGLSPMRLWVALYQLIDGGFIRVPHGIAEFATIELCLPEPSPEGGEVAE